MNKYTAEELRGIRRYKRELRVRRQRTVRVATRVILIALVLWLLTNIPSLSPEDTTSALDKYPTQQSYQEHLDSLHYTEVE